MEKRRLYRVEEGAKLAGVCGGIAEFFDIDPTVVRLITVILFFAGTLSLWVYLIAALIMPRKSDIYPGSWNGPGSL